MMLKSFHTIFTLASLGSALGPPDTYVPPTYDASPTSTMSIPFPLESSLQSNLTASRIGMTQVPSPIFVATVTDGPTSTVGLPTSQASDASSIPATIYAIDNCLVPGDVKGTTICPDYPQDTATKTVENYFLYTAYEGGNVFNYQAVITDHPNARKLTRRVEASCAGNGQGTTSCVVQTTTTSQSIGTDAPSQVNESPKTGSLQLDDKSNVAVDVIENAAAPVGGRQPGMLAALVAIVAAVALA
jgi:hypothetical protein